MTAVDDLTLSIPRGAFYALLGPSGCGKTTTLRMIGGFEDPTAGSVFLGGDEVTQLPPYKRDVNTVFQSYALFPHLTRREERRVRPRAQEDLQVRGHARASARRSRWSSSASYGKRKPAQLSGGQQQRVALARALVNRPRALLLDEPLGALDLRLRKQLQIELKRIQQDVGITFVHVTHDQEEAMSMADTIAVMNEGRIEQAGARRRPLRAPAHRVRRQLPRRLEPRRRADARLRRTATPRSRRTTAPRCTCRRTGSARTAPTRSASASGPRRSRSPPPASAVAERHQRARGTVVVAVVPRRLDPVRHPRRGRRGADRVRPEPRRRGAGVARRRAARSSSPGIRSTRSSSPRRART